MRTPVQYIPAILLVQVDSEQHRYEDSQSHEEEQEEDQFGLGLSQQSLPEGCLGGI
jgi:hypothetical protein